MVNSTNLPDADSSVEKSDVALTLSKDTEAGAAEDIRRILDESRLTASRNVKRQINESIIDAYWHIGERIVRLEQSGNPRSAYGEGVLRSLSKRLTSSFGDGFSYANLRNMRQFFLTYPDYETCRTLCSPVSWSHNRLIMRIRDPKARNFYLTESHANQWSVRVLERNIASNYYQRLLSTKTPEAGTTAGPEESIRSFIKDPYVVEFLKLPKDRHHSEKELEERLIGNLQKFLLELGKGFAFVGRQYRISTETSHYYIDLVFYNYILKCFVLIDLKADKLTHQDIGQMDMYRRMFDDLVRSENDAPTVGILLCADKDETVVRYSVLNESEKLFASKYLTYLPTEEELKEEMESSYLTESIAENTDPD